MDVFMEKIVARQRTGKDMLVTAGIIIAVPAAFILLMNIPYLNKLVGSFWLLALAGLIYGAYHLIKSRSIEYEYIVTNGELDIDKIIAKRKRKRIFGASSKDVDILAKYRGTHYEPSMDQIQNKIEAVSTMEADDIYFIVLNYKGERTIVFFQPTEKMLDSLRRFNPRKIFKTDSNIQGL